MGLKDYVNVLSPASSSFFPTPAPTFIGQTEHMDQRPKNWLDFAFWESGECIIICFIAREGIKMRREQLCENWVSWWDRD